MNEDGFIFTMLLLVVVLITALVVDSGVRDHIADKCLLEKEFTVAKKKFSCEFIGAK